MRTRIDGSWVIAYDGSRQAPIADGCVVVNDEIIEYVGPNDGRDVDRVVGGPGCIVSPGFINTHFHCSTQAAEVMMLDHGRHDTFNTGWLSYAPRAREGGAPRSRQESVEASIGASLRNAVLGGSTTIVEIGSENIGAANSAALADAVEAAGLRAYVGSGFSDGTWFHRSASEVDISWDTAAGRAGLDDAIEFALRVRGEYSSRVEPVLVPYEVARSTPDLIRTVAEASEKYDLLVTTHCAEAQLEVFRTLSAHGCTPVEYLERHGLLGPRTLLGHCVFVDEHSSLLTSQKKDLSRIAEAGASVAHSPLPYARRGLRLESFDSYIDSGVNVALGTDSIPQDVFYEMKLVSLMSKVTERSFEAGHADRVFNAATVGGARALGRQDIGVLTAGARADILVIDSLETSMGPIRNPISSLVHLAQSRDLASVFVDGREIYSRDAQHNESVDRLKHEVQGSAEKVWSYFEGQYVSDSFGQQVIPKVQ